MVIKIKPRSSFARNIRMLSHSSLVHLRGLGGDLIWFWLPPTCALQMPERPLGDSNTVMQELLVVTTACYLEKAFANSFCASDMSLWKQTKVVFTAQTSDQREGIKFFSESNCLQPVPVFRVMTP